MSVVGTAVVGTRVVGVVVVGVTVVGARVIGAAVVPAPNTHAMGRAGHARGAQGTRCSRSTHAAVGAATALYWYSTQGDPVGTQEAAVGTAHR